MESYTISTDDVPVAVFATVAVKSNYVMLTRALTADVTLSYYVINDTAKPEAVACWKQAAPLKRLLVSKCVHY